MGGHAFSARRALDLAHLRHGGTGCGKTHFQVPQRLKPRSYESTYRSAGSAAPPQTGGFSAACETVPIRNCANPRVFRNPLVQSRNLVAKVRRCHPGRSEGPCITNQLHRSFNSRVFPHPASVVRQLGGTSPALSTWAKDLVII